MNDILKILRPEESWVLPVSTDEQTDLLEYGIQNPVFPHALSSKLSREKIRMAKLSEEANNYVPPTSKNICELEEVSVDLDVQSKTVGEGDKAFTYKFIMVNDEEYRVGASVLKQLKAQMEEKPDLKKFKVTKEGEGLGTSYTLIPLK